MEGCDGATCGGSLNGTGELAMFWMDLSTAQLIDNGFVSGTNLPSPGPIGPITITATSSPSLDAWLPRAKIGNGAYVNIYTTSNTMITWPGGLSGYYGVSPISSLQANTTVSGNAFTVQQAYVLDKKIDDGFPQTGSIMAAYLTNWGFLWAGSFGSSICLPCAPTTAAAGYAATNCFDNATVAHPGGVNGVIQTYSTWQNAAALNCNLNFRFQ